MKVALVVQGRFHAFDLARELLARGHDVTVFTNYPQWAVSRFGLPTSAVRSCWTHGVADRAVRRLGGRAADRWWEACSHRWFGTWAARELARGSWDVIHAWSGVSKELLERRTSAARPLTVLMRGSAHIRTQDRLLAEEAARVGCDVERPSPWMVQRECDEYGRVDAIAVLSDFAAKTFLQEGVPADRIERLLLGVDTRDFTAATDVIGRRAQRIRSGVPLTVLFVGTVSYQKGVWDLIAAAREVTREPFIFDVVGELQDEVKRGLPDVPPNVRLRGKVAQHQLPSVYAEADLFLFPTIQDGFAMVLTQALAAGVPVITTTNCAGPELVADGVNGWVVPIRRPDLLVSRLRWCAAHRSQLAELVTAMPAQPVRDWRAVAADFEALVERRVATQDRKAQLCRN